MNKREAGMDFAFCFLDGFSLKADPDARHSL
jgi:hypothetical protein